MPADTLGPGLTPLARPCISARAVQDQSASPRRRLTRCRPRGGGLNAYAAGVGEFQVLVECLCAQKEFVHTSLALAEDDDGAGRRMVSVVQVCACAVLTLSVLC